MAFRGGAYPRLDITALSARNIWLMNACLLSPGEILGDRLEDGVRIPTKRLTHVLRRRNGPVANWLKDRLPVRITGLSLGDGATANLALGVHDVKPDLL